MVIKCIKETESRTSLPFIYFNVILDLKRWSNGLILISSTHVYVYTFFNFELYKNIDRFIQKYKLVKKDRNFLIIFRFIGYCLYLKNMRALKFLYIPVSYSCEQHQELYNCYIN